MIGDANERGMPVMLLRGSKERERILFASEQNLRNMNSSFDRNIVSRGTEDSSSLSPKVFHGKHEEYLNDYQSYVRRQLRKKGNVMTEKLERIIPTKLPASRDYHKIGEYNRIYNRRKKPTSTAGSGFPLLKDALAEEMIRAERKRRYAEELRAQMLQNEMRRRSRLPHKVTSSQEIVKFYQDGRGNDEHWYEYAPEPRKISHPPNLPAIQAYRSQQPNPNMYGQVEEESRAVVFETPPASRGDYYQPQRRDVRQNPDNYYEGEFHQPHHVPTANQIDLEDSLKPRAEDFQKKNQRVPPLDLSRTDDRRRYAQMEVKKSRTRRAGESFVKPSTKRSLLVEKYHKRAQLGEDELQLENYTTKYFGEKDREDPTDRAYAQESYIQELQQQIEDKKALEKRKKIEEKMADLLAEEKYLNELKMLEEAALLENERKLEEARLTSEENQKNVEIRKGLSVIPEMRSELEKQSEVFDRNIIGNVKQASDQSYEPQRAIIQSNNEEEQMLMSRNINYRSQLVDQQKREFELNNRIMHTQLVDLRAKVTHSTNLKNKALHNYADLQKSLNNSRRENSLQIGRLKNELIKKSLETPIIEAEPFGLKEKVPSIFSIYGDSQSIKDQNIALKSEAEMIPIDYSKAGKEILEYFDSLEERGFNRQVALDSERNTNITQHSKIETYSDLDKFAKTPLEDKEDQFSKMVNELIEECREMNIDLEEELKHTNFRSADVEYLDHLLSSLDPVVRENKIRDANRSPRPDTPPLLKASDYDWEHEYQKREEEKKKMVRELRRRNTEELFGKPVAGNLALIDDLHELDSHSIDISEEFDPDKIYEQGKDLPIGRIAREDQNNSSNHSFDPDKIYEQGKNLPIGRHIRQESDDATEDYAFDPDKIYDEAKNLPLGRLIKNNSGNITEPHSLSVSQDFDPDKIYNEAKNLPNGRLI